MKMMKHSAALVAAMMLFALGASAHESKPLPEVKPTPATVVPVTQIVNVDQSVKVPVNMDVDVKVPVTVAPVIPVTVTVPVIIKEGSTAIEGSHAAADASAVIEEGAVKNNVKNVATGGSVGDTTSQSTSGVAGSGNSAVDVDAGVKDSGNAKVAIDDHSVTKVLSISPHSALVPNAPIPTVFDHSNGANATGISFQLLVSRHCVMNVSRDVKRIRMKGEDTQLVFTPFARDVYSGATPESASVIEKGAVNDPQRYRCLGTLLVFGDPKKAEFADIATIEREAILFTQEHVRGGNTLGLLFDACAISINNGVLSFGRGTGVSAGGSNVWDSALGTLMGGLSGNKGRSFNVNQLGATYVIIVPTEKGGFTLGDLAAPALASTIAPPAQALGKPGELLVQSPSGTPQ